MTEDEDLRYGVECHGYRRYVVYDTDQEVETLGRFLNTVTRYKVVGWCRTEKRARRLAARLETRHRRDTEAKEAFNRKEQP